MKIIITTKKSLEAILRKTIESILDKRLPKQSDLPPQHPLDAYLNANAAAAFLRISLSTLYGLSSKKLIPLTKKGKKLYFKKQDLIDWLNNANQKNESDINKESENHV